MHAVARPVLLSSCVALSLALAGCSPDSEPGGPAPGPQPEAAAASVHFPTPPGSRSIAASIDPGTLVVPLGPAGVDGGLAAERVEGTIRRRMNVLPMQDDGSGLSDFHRAQIQAQGFRVLYECEGLEGCGGAGFVSTVAEEFTTRPRSSRLASMVTGFMQPQTGFVQHYSLHRAAGGEDLYVTVTAVRSDSGPVTVLTQSNEHTSATRPGLE